MPRRKKKEKKSSHPTASNQRAPRIPKRGKMCMSPFALSLSETLVHTVCAPTDDHDEDDQTDINLQSNLLVHSPPHLPNLVYLP